MGLLHTLHFLLAAFFGAGAISSSQGMATRFGEPGDPLNGGAMFCTKQVMQPGELACAHRTLPCGTTLLVQNVRNGKFAMCTVADRGPYGALLPNGKWHIKRTKKEAGKWRGVLDMSPTVAKNLSFNGNEPVRIYFPKAAIAQAKHDKEVRRERAAQERIVKAEEQKIRAHHRAALD